MSQEVPVEILQMKIDLNFITLHYFQGMILIQMNG